MFRRKPDVAVAVDLGSTAIKVAAFDASGRQLLALTSPFTPRRRGRMVDFEAYAYLKAARSMLEEATIMLGDASSRIVGLGVSSQRSTVAFWDRKGDLAPAMSWQDLRAADFVRRISRQAELVGEKTGLALSAHYSAPKIRWALDHIESVRRAAERRDLLVGPLSTYLIWHLTGGRVYAVDPTQAQRMLLWNPWRGRWDADLCDIFGVPPAVLPELRPTVAAYGEASIGALRVAVRASIGDMQAACVAAGLGRKRPVTVTYGTGAFLARFSGERPSRCPGLLTSVYMSRGRKRTYFLEGTVNSAASLLDHLSTGPEVEFRRVSLSRDALIPALSGLGSPHWLPSARLICMGPGRACRTDMEILGAEAVAYRLRENLELLQAFGYSMCRLILASGGLCERPGFLDAQAGILCVPVVALRGGVSAAEGAAALVLGRSWKTDRTVSRAKPRRGGQVLGSLEWQRAVHLFKASALRPAFAGSLWEEKLCRTHPLFFAHRGALSMAPENTMAALREAVRAGADGVEFDVRLSCDGIPVVIHDATLDRTTDGRGPVHIRSSALLRKLDAGSWFSDSFRGERIPLLREVFEELPADLLLYVEMKDDVAGARLWRNVFSLVERHGVLGRVVMASFDVTLARKFKKEVPRALVGAIIGRRHPRIDPRRPLYPELDVLSFGSSLASSALVWRCRLQSQLAAFWTVDRSAEAGKLYRMGAGGIVTNRIEKLGEFRRAVST